MTASSSEITPLSALSGVDAVTGSHAVLETHADQLVEELFEEVEQVLRDPYSLTPQTQSAPGTGQQSTALAVIPRAGRLQSLAPATEPLHPYVQTPLAPELPIATRIGERQPDPERQGRSEVAQKHRRSRRTVQGLLLGAGGMSVLLAVGTGLAIQMGWLQRLRANTTPLLSAQSPTQTLTPDPFLDYLQQALDRVDAQQPTPSSAAKTPSPAATNSQSAIGLPPLPSPTSQGSPLPTLAVPATPPTGARELTSPPEAEADPSPIATSTPKPPVAALPPSVPKLKHVLTGVLELGDQSAAMITVNGVTQRIRVGETVSASGWILVRVANREAVIQRNQEVYSIQIGQTF